MWSTVLPILVYLRDAVVEFAKTIVNVFTTDIIEYIETAPAWLSWVTAFIPDVIGSLSLFEIMTASFLPIMLIVCVVKLVSPID